MLSLRAPQRVCSSTTRKKTFIDGSLKGDIQPKDFANLGETYEKYFHVFRVSESRCTETYWFKGFFCQIETQPCLK